MARTIDPAQLLADAAWLRRLAARVAGADDADDVAQDALIAAWRKAPEARASLRPWLAKVVRDGGRMLRRGRARRGAREAAGAVAVEPRGADVLLAEARLHQALVTAVLALDEPYRHTILARFVEGQAAREIARRDGVPVGTVRWRQAEGVRRLRLALDAHAPRRTWAAIALGAAARTGGSLARVALVAAVASALAIAIVAWWLTGGEPGGGGAPLVDRRARAAASAAAHVGAPPPLDEAPARWVPASAATRRVAGRVVDAADRPVAGARLTLDATVAGVGGAAGVQHAVTDADGRFAIAPRWHEHAVLTADADGFAAASVLVDPRGRVGAEPDDLLIRLSACAHRVIGSVRDVGGGAIAGAQVRRQIDAMPNRTGPAVTADDDGRWQLCVPAGPSWLEVGADGYERVVRGVNVHGDHALDVALVPAAVVRGVVRDAASGAPIVGAAVTLWPWDQRGGGAAARGARSDGDGGFAIDGLAGGQYELIAIAPGYVDRAQPEVQVVAARDAAPMVIELIPAVTVAVTVTAAGAPVPGVEVWLERGGGGHVASGHGITDRAGRVTLTRVPRAAGQVPRVRGWEVVAPATIDVSGAAPPPLALAVVARPSLRGVVVRDGRPVADAEVAVVGPGGRATTRSDGRGAFVVEGLASGSHRAYAGALAIGAFTATPVDVTLPTAAPITLSLDGGGAITGRVIDQDGRPVVGVVVTAQHIASDDTGGGPTALDGSFVADALAGGRYRLRVDPYRGAATPLPWASAPPPLVAVAGGDARVGPLVLRVTRAVGTIAGRVVDADGAPVADAFVRLGPVWGTVGGAPVARTTPDGRFELPTAGPGPFVVDAGQSGGPAAVARAVRAGQRDLVLTLVAPGRLRGTFGDGDGTVWLRRGGGFDAAAAASPLRQAAIEAGRFGFDGLAPGRWHASVITARGVAAVATIEIRAAAVTEVALAAVATRSLRARVVAASDGTAIAGATCVAAPALGDVRPPAVDRRTPGARSTDRDGDVALLAPVGPALIVCEGPPGWSSGAARLADGDAAVTVTLVDHPDRMPGALGFWFDAERLDAVVASVVPGAASPLAVGDRVVAVDGQPVDGLYQGAIYWLLAGRPYGDQVPVTVERGGVRLEHVVAIAPPG
ncbi:MAG: carboxypeptidase regulatory-like domain-containing protein [Myxococcales bacterium]|nr:carboxypeptidase regulatory-like domain-containing protein [Myxococcales bacterium]